MTTAWSPRRLVEAYYDRLRIEATDAFYGLTAPAPAGKPRCGSRRSPSPPWWSWEAHGN